VKWVEHAGVWSSSSLCTLMVYRVFTSALVFSSFISFLCLSVLSSCVLKSFLFDLAAFGTLICLLAEGGVYNLIFFYGCVILNVVHFGNVDVCAQDRTKTCCNIGSCVSEEDETGLSWRSVNTVIFLVISIRIGNFFRGK